MKKFSLVRPMIVAFPLAVMGCLGAEDDSASAISAAQAPDSGVAGSPAAAGSSGGSAAAPASTCPILPSARVTAEDVRARLPTVNASFEIEDAFEVTQDPGTECFFNAALAGMGVRVNGEFRIPNAVTVNTTAITTSLVPDPTGVEPYLLRAVIPVGDVAFVSDGEVEMSTNCIRLRRVLEGDIRDLSIAIDYAPPSTTRTTFVQRAVIIDYDRIRVRNPDALIPEFSAVMAVINTFLNTEAQRTVVSNSIVANLVDGGIPLALSALAVTPAFYAASGLSINDRFCSVSLSTCSGARCAHYHRAR